MENRDFIIEQILSLEDFENVDKALMAKIDDNEEYRRIFEEYREVSRLTRECVPTPEKDGVSLHDAVMGRVKSGDIAPRYINSGTGKLRFPVATVASLAVILIVAVVAKVTNDAKTDNGMRYYAHCNSEPVLMAELKDDAAPTESAVLLPYPEVARAIPEENGDAEAFSEDGIAEEAETEAVTETEAVAEAGSDDGTETKGILQSSMAGSPKAESAQEPDGSTVTSSGKSDSSENGWMECGFGGYNSEDSVQQAEPFFEDIGAKIRIIFVLLEKYDIEESRKITPEDIELYGEEKFVEWFFGIYGREDFVSLYGIDEFIEYCESGNG